MTRSVFSARPPLWVRFAAVAIFAIVLFGTASIALAQGDGATGADDRLVTIYENGTEKTIVTKATTVAGALQQAGVEVETADAVEPSIDTELIAKSYSVNIYRARPVVVVDGSQKIRVMTAAQSSGKIAESAGVTLYAEDKTTTSRVDDVLVGGGAGITMTIERATPVNLVLYGKATTVRTQSQTVDALLNEKGITLGAEDTLSINRTAKITANMTIEIWRNGKQTVAQDEDIVFEIEQVKDADREVGFKEIKEPGENGKKSVTYEIEMKNGVEVARVEIQSVTIKEPKKQIEIIGSKPKVAAVPSNSDANAELGHQMMLAYGFSEDNWPCLYNLWTRESGWRTNAGNPSSGAYGIPQSLPASKMASVGSDYLTNPATQITWGLGYIKGRYGTPCGAWSSFQAKGWY